MVPRDDLEQHEIPALERFVCYMIQVMSRRVQQALPLVDRGRVVARSVVERAASGVVARAHAEVRGGAILSQRLVLYPYVGSLVWVHVDQIDVGPAPSVRFQDRLDRLDQRLHHLVLVIFFFIPGEAPGADARHGDDGELALLGGDPVRLGERRGQAQLVEVLELLVVDRAFRFSRTRLLTRRRADARLVGLLGHQRAGDEDEVAREPVLRVEYLWVGPLAVVVDDDRHRDGDGAHDPELIVGPHVEI